MPDLPACVKAVVDGEQLNVTLDEYWRRGVRIYLEAYSDIAVLYPPNHAKGARVKAEIERLDRLYPEPPGVRRPPPRDYSNASWAQQVTGDSSGLPI